MTFKVRVSTVLLVAIISMSSPKKGFGQQEDEQDPEVLWKSFMEKFKKKYDDDAEKNRRFLIFKDRLEVIRKNNRPSRKKFSYKMGVNYFSDKTYNEILKYHTGIINPYGPRNNGRKKRSYDWYIPTQAKPLPCSNDYRQSGAVNPVIDQLDCGSCWATSITASIESAIFLKEGKLHQLSVQNLVDCAHDYGPRGCNGGWPEDAIKYVIDKGISYSKDYPYRNGEGFCENTPTKYNYVIKFKKVYEGNDNDLMDALKTIGPISITMFITQNFIDYKSGVFRDPLCNGYIEANHAMTLVGYGTERGRKYWLVRNSWGTEKDWGEKGYIKVDRDQPNHCLISEHGVIPTIQGPVSPKFCYTEWDEKYSC